MPAMSLTRLPVGLRDDSAVCVIAAVALALLSPVTSGLHFAGTLAALLHACRCQRVFRLLRATWLW